MKQLILEHLRVNCTEMSKHGAVGTSLLSFKQRARLDIGLANMPHCFSHSNRDRIADLDFDTILQYCMEEVPWESFLDNRLSRTRNQFTISSSEASLHCNSQQLHIAEFTVWST